MPNGIIASGCCCTPAVDNCPKWMGTTYLVDNISGSYAATWRTRIDLPGCSCVSGEPEAFPLEVSISISYAQYTPVVAHLVKRCCNPGAVCSCCCYRATGTLEVSWTVTRQTYASYCDQCDPESTLIGSASEEGVTLTSFCLDILPYGSTPSGCNWTGTTAQGWIHRLSICGFPLTGNLDFRVDYRDPEGNPMGCGSFYQYPPVGAYCRGATISYASDYDPLDQIGGSAGFLGWCYEVEDGCGEPLGIEEGCLGTIGCLPCVDNNSVNRGPFALASIEEFTEQDVPELCIPGSGLGTRLFPFCDGPSITTGYDPCNQCGALLDASSGCCAVRIEAGPPGFWVYT
jgi:hypothetical protein